MRKVAITFDLEESDIEEGEFKSSVRKILRDEIDKRIRKLIHTKSHGLWYLWQRNKIENFEYIPVNHQERFNWFIVESVPPLKSGEYHLHAFYDKSRSESYWKLTSGSSVCKVPGRCVRAEVKLCQ